MRAVLAACLALGCGRSQGVADRDLGGLVIAEKRTPPPIALDRVGSEPDELGRAMMLPYHELVAALGDHSVAIAMVTRVTEHGKPVSVLDEKTALERGDQGTFHAVYTNSEDYGREASYVAGVLYLRPRYQRWHARAPAPPDEPIALADQFYEPISATWDVFAPGVAVADKGAVQSAGRTGRAVAITLASAPRRNAPEPLAQRKWREHRTVKAIAGDIVLDAQHGTPLAVNLTGTVEFQRDNRTFAMEISLHSSIASIGQPVPITAPPASDVVATPERLREVDDRDFLLHGIAPPLRRQRGGPSGALPAATGATSP